MILNKSAHERGFGYGTVYKTDVFDLQGEKGAVKSLTHPSLHFAMGKDVREDHIWRKTVDDDGLPRVGARVVPGDALATFRDDLTGRTRMHKYKGDEIAYVDEVRVIGTSRFKSLALEETEMFAPLNRRRRW